MSRLIHRIACVLSIVGLVALSQGAEAIVPRGFVLTAETDSLSLYVDHTSTAIAVVSKDGGGVWYSNPQNLAQREQIARGETRDRMNAQLVLAFYTPRLELRRMDTYNDSIQHDQYELVPLENGVRVEYTLGKTWQDEDYLPVFVPQNQFEEQILVGISDRWDRELFVDNYTLVTFEPKHLDSHQLEIAGVDLAAVFGNLEPVVPGRTLTLPRQERLLRLLIDHLVAHSDSIERRGDIKAEHVAPFLEQPTYVRADPLPRWDVDDMIPLLRAIGYSPQDVAQAHQIYGLREPSPNPRVFQIAMEYVLEGDNLLVRVPYGDIVYPKAAVDASGRPISFPLHQIDVLPFFGAADATQTGYLFVPDGSGALIHLNNGRLFAPAYQGRVYGSDLSVSQVVEQTVWRQPVRLPVFGLHDGQKSFFAIIEQGQSLASVVADVSGRNSSFNTAFSRFLYLERARVGLRAMPQHQGGTQLGTAGQNLHLYPSRSYQGDVQVRYAFLTGPDSGYETMARYYQEYLVREFGLTKLPPQELPLTVELIGAITRSQSVWGIPRQVVQPVTTLAQAQEITGELLSQVPEGLRLVYSGLLRGGLRHDFPSRFILESKLGNSQQLQKLADYLQDQGVPFYPEVGFLRVYQDRLFDGFSARADSAWSLTRQIARAYDYDPGTYRLIENSAAFILSPTRLPSLVDGFLTSWSASGFGTRLALTHMGTEVHSHFSQRMTEYVDREQALATIENALTTVASQTEGILLRGGNAYALPFAETIVDLSLESSLHGLINESVPFMPMVLHGYVNYSGPPLNLAGDLRHAFLKHVETGASPYFQWFYQDNSAVKHTDFGHLYSAGYDAWRDQALAMYVEANAVLRHVQSQRIVAHRRLAPEIYQTVFEKGYAVVVNYGSHASQILGVTVGARDFVLLEEALNQ